VRKTVSVENAEGAKSDEEKEELPVDELVQTASPFTQKPRESTTGGRCHLVLVTDSHLAAQTTAS
jgi:hypothetical protein